MDAEPQGWHLALECAGCDLGTLTDLATLEKLMVQAAKDAGATVVEHVFHQFSPYGLSGVVIIAESHLAIHTWPEHGFASIDVFTCRSAALTEKIGENLVATLRPTKISRKLVSRRPPR